MAFGKIFCTFILFVTAFISFASASVLSVTSADGVSINYEIQGKGSPTLFFVHGWSCDSTYWSDQISFFKDKFQVITIDLPGHGKSGDNREFWTVAKFGEDVASVANQLDLKQVILIGHSLGGPIVIEAEPRISDRVIGIVGVDSGALKDPTKDPTQESVDRLLGNLRSDFPNAMKGIVKKYLFLPVSDPDLVDKVANDMAQQDPEIGIEVMKELRIWQMGNDWDSVKRVKKPITFINSERSLPNEELFEQTVHFRYRLMSDVGHFPMMEKPKIFNQLLLEEIEEIVHFIN